MARQIALLRGINLGPSRRVPMAELRTLLAGLGYERVRTHLQSGNVVLDAAAPPQRLAADVERALEQRFGFAVAVVVRTRDELAEIIANDPFGELVDEPRRYQVTFCTKAPARPVVRALEAADLAPERVVVAGREIYAWHPGGIQRSRLAGMLTDAKLGVTATARNWNTVTKLLELAEG